MLKKRKLIMLGIIIFSATIVYINPTDNSGYAHFKH